MTNRVFDNFIYLFLLLSSDMAELKQKMAGEITVSEEPGSVIKKWRDIFKISQTRLADQMDIASSVISDYEKGRRQPGVQLVKKIVESMLEIDKERGGDKIERFTRPGQEGILSIGEFGKGFSMEEMIEKIEGDTIYSAHQERELYGYTVIDSIKAILSMRSFDYLSIYGYSTERILFFKGVEYGHSPLVAIRSTPLTPAAVAYIQPKKVDDLSYQLAEKENVTLLRTELETQELIDILKKGRDIE